jgi:glycosyltransferase involved in cell wall biosynthesis
MQVDVNYAFSSTGKIVADLVSGLNELGHTTAAFYGRGANSNLENVHKISSDFEVVLHALSTRLTGLTDGFSPLSTNRLIAHIESFKPDIIHLHDLHGYYLNIEDLVVYLKRKKIPTVWTFHCEFMYTGKCGYAFDCVKWKTECDQCPRLNDYPQSLFFDFTNRMFLEKKKMFDDFHLLHIVSPSGWLADRIRQSIVGNKKLSVIYNGIDTEIFNERSTSLIKSKFNIGDQFVVLSVGSDLLSSRKGGKWILELARRNFSKNIIFIMVGVDQMPKNIPNNVRIVHRINDQDLLAEYYSLADVLLLTSEKETFSMVSAESLACGTPIIGFDSGAPKEVALPGYGQFVSYADLNALESLLHAAKEGGVKFMSSNECINFARRRYSKNTMVDAYLKVYQSLLENK